MNIRKNNHQIDQSTRELISNRFKRITKSINNDFWNSNSDVSHSIFVGSFGRGTAIEASDVDVLFILPDDEFDHFSSLAGNGPSRLLQVVKNAILDTYPNTDIRGDGQVVVVDFFDGMRFEVLPAFKKNNVYGLPSNGYRYPNSHMGGNWLSTNPEAEIQAIKSCNSYNFSNGLLTDTCKHIRYVRSQQFSSLHLSGILIDSFVYASIGGWHWTRDGEQGRSGADVSYEQHLLNKYESFSRTGIMYAPGSNDRINVSDEDWDVLGKIIRRIV